MTDVSHRHATYPFFEAARQRVGDFEESFMLTDAVRARAVDRVAAAVTTDDVAEADHPIGEPSDDNHVELVSYPLARLLVSLLDDPIITDRYIRTEAAAAVTRLHGDDLTLAEAGDEFGIPVEEYDFKSLFHDSALFDHWADLDVDERHYAVYSWLNDPQQPKEHAQEDTTIPKEQVDQPLDDAYRVISYGLNGQKDSRYAIPVPAYLAHAPLDDGDHWALTRRSVIDGHVLVRERELETLLEHAIRERVGENLPLDVPADLASALDDTVTDLLDRLPPSLRDTVDATTFPLLDADTLPRQYPIGTEDYDQYEPLGAGEVDLDITDIRDHYHKAEAVYKELGQLDGMHTSWLGAAGHTGWYVSDDLDAKDDHPDAWDAGFSKYSRPAILPGDFDASEAGRSVYTTNTYAPREAFTRRYYTIEDGERVWMDDALDDVDEVTRLPDYDELGAFALIVDIDLEDDWKNRPLPDDYQQVVEQRLEAWVGAFAQFLDGNIDDVFAVDSGGGAYVMTPPTATLPIREEFDGDDLYLINNEMQTRMRTLTEALDDIITGLDDAPDDLFSADAVQNKNRQWKSPMSVHSSLDVVVHPIDPTDVDYDELSFDDLDQKDYADAASWAADFTATKHCDYVGTLVKALFQTDVYDRIDSPYATFEGDDWVEILENFVEQRKQEKEARQEAFQRIERGNRSIGNVGVTTDKFEVDAAIANVDLEQYLKDGHVQQWDTDNRSDGTVSFSPRTWRSPSADANSCFYSPSGGTNNAPVFVDRKEGWTAGIIDLIAYEEGITSHPSDTPTGRDWWTAVDALRENGEDIPVHLPDIEDASYDSEKLGIEYIVKAALALDIADEEDDVVDREGEYGTYRTLADPELYNQTIDALEDRNIKHGRDSRNTDD